MIKHFPSNPLPTWLECIQADSPFPVMDVLNDSIFYPASNTDGSILKYYGGFTHSFVYVDPNVEKIDLLRQLFEVSGYSVLFGRWLPMEQLCFKPFQPIYPIPGVDDDPTRLMLHDKPIQPYAFWTVFERREKVKPAHGPKRFSLLFIAGEGVATYQAIYNSNRARPLAIVLKGYSGFAGNWTGFECRGGMFERVVMSNLGGFPDYLLCNDRYGSEYERPVKFNTWNNYEKFIDQNPHIDLNAWKAERTTYSRNPIPYIDE